MQELKTILHIYKSFAIIVFAILFLSLIRIPLGTFNQGSTIDTVSHFALPAFGAPLLYALLTHLGYLPTLKSPGILLMILLIGVSAEVVWEIFEFHVDWFFSLQWQVSNTDTMYDLILAFVGSITGGLLYLRRYNALRLARMIGYDKKQWSTKI